MADSGRTIGIIGTGALGGAIGRALLRAGAVAPGDLWLASRSGRAVGFDTWPGVTVTSDPAALVGACATLLLAVPPAEAGRIGIAAGDRLVISVMAGVTLARLREITGASRIVRAMSSPAAERGLAYSPWIAAPAVTQVDRATVTALFAACGLTDEVGAEHQIDHFTAMTGPVPGFVAFMAATMVDYAVARGIEPGVADRAVRQLFLASGTILAEEPDTPAAQVQAMIDYAGTTAAGLTVLQHGALAAALAEGLDAAAAGARAMG